MLVVVVLYVVCLDLFFFFFKQKTAYEIVSRDWSSDVCSSDLPWFLASFVLLCLKILHHEEMSQL